MISQKKLEIIIKFFDRDKRYFDIIFFFTLFLLLYNFLVEIIAY